MAMPSVDVLIPAYNEERNIEHVIRQVLSQRQETFSLRKVFVYSDGSTDSTIKLAKEINDERIIVIEESNRKGLATAFNTLLEHAAADIAVLLNADIVLADEWAINNLIDPIRIGDADATAARIEELPAKSFFESMLASSMQWKKRAFFAWKGGNNIFTCFGPARAFSRRMYKDMQLPFSACDDAYSYLLCMKMGYRFICVKNAIIYYRLPSLFIDHMNQSMRYADGMNQLRHVFSSASIDSETAIPRNIMVRSAFQQLRRTPGMFVLYIACTALLVILKPFVKKQSLLTWKVAQTSKTSVSL